VRRSERHIGPDPERPGRERYWSGEDWTEETRLPPPVVPVARSGTRRSPGLGTFGAALAIVGILVLALGGNAGLLGLGVVVMLIAFVVYVVQGARR
jgi:hypothetical protein